MGEKGRRLLTVGVGGITLAACCFIAAMLPEREPSESFHRESLSASVLPESSPPESSSGSGRIEGPITEALAEDAARAFAEAGTPFFTDPAALTLPQMEEAALWLMIERGEMPLPEGGEVRVEGGTLMEWVETLFGISGLPPEDCAMGSYNPESDQLILPAAAFFPVYAPVVEEPEWEGNELTLRVSLFSPEGWEGDVEGNIYLSEQMALGVLQVEDGWIRAYQSR